MPIRHLALLFLAATGFAADPGSSRERSDEGVIRLVFSPQADLKRLEIRYFITGSFGGYGSFVPITADAREYRIETVYNNQPAKTFKAIVWCPGYETLLLSRPALPESRAETAPIELKPLKWLPLNGRLMSVTNTSDLDIDAVYVARWSHAFWGIVDGSVEQFRVAATHVATNGSFALWVPDLAHDPADVAFGEQPMRGVIRLIAREASTGNFACDLAEVQKPGRGIELPLSTQYPTNLELTAVPQNASFENRRS